MTSLLAEDHPEFVVPKLPPGPKGYPLLGILPYLRANPLQYFVDVSREYGDFVRLDFGPQKFFLVNQPDAIRQILQDKDGIFEKGYDLVKAVTGNGLIASEGELWLRQRRIMQPAFHHKKISGLIAIMTDNIGAVIDRWHAWSQSGADVDIEAEMFRLTRFNIVRSMFGLDIESELDQTGEDFEACLQYLAQLMKAPFKFLTYVPTPTNVRFKKARRRLDQLVYAILEKRREQKIESDDLLDLLLSARDSDGNEGMSDQQLRDEVITLLMTGHETSASALTWTWYLLSRHQAVLDKVRHEIKRVLGARKPEFEDLQHLEYTGMVIDEVLRLYPSTWLFARKATRDFTLASYRLPGNAMIFLSPFIVHRDARIWADPEVFRPERFHPETKSQRHPFAYFPFGGGPRRCIGETIALTVMKLVVAMLLQRFRLEPISGGVIEPVPKATLRMSDRFRVRIREN